MVNKTIITEETHPKCLELIKRELYYNDTSCEEYKSAKKYLTEDGSYKTLQEIIPIDSLLYSLLTDYRWIQL